MVEDGDEILSSGQLKDKLAELEAEAAALEDECTILKELFLRKHYRTMCDAKFMTTKKRSNSSPSQGTRVTAKKQTTRQTKVNVTSVPAPAPVPHQPVSTSDIISGNQKSPDSSVSVPLPTTTTTASLERQEFG
jgi:hypothetical protein